MVCHGVTGFCQSLYIKGGRLGHYGLETVGGIAIGGGSHIRDHYARWRACAGAMITLQVITRCNPNENNLLLGLHHLPSHWHLCEWLPGGGRHEEFPPVSSSTGYCRKKNPPASLHHHRLDPDRGSDSG